MIRQMMDNGGFYEQKTNELLKLVNVILVGAMGIPGGGRTLPSKRLLRHFNVLHIPPFSSENLFRIFSKLLEWGF
jgi:dynein heavy chain